MSTTTSPKPDSGTYDQSMLTWVKEQVCGIPNGDPNLFDAVEGLNSSQLIRGAVPKTVVNSAAKFHQSRFTVQQTIVGGFEAPNGSASICWQVRILSMLYSVILLYFSHGARLQVDYTITYCDWSHIHLICRFLL